jgi:ribulose 1,5-bisphosphate carboxylase large subunit-like protein
MLVGKKKDKDDSYSKKYIAPKGWKPKNADRDYIITFLDIELADGIGMDQFETVVAACAAESSTGTWTKVYSGKDSGVEIWLVY